jgi:hypothetical protein
LGYILDFYGLAARQGISLAMVLQMAKEMTGKGYLQEIGADCEEPQKGCADCPVSSGCQAAGRHWFLTEKGRNAVANNSKS